ncbi:MAG: M3 family oligoendopeptidase [Anaerolineaceae bacterium]|nr:MAG: M3 family oligoendopeptidase [Anaerolineaceae bacterium]
MYNEWSLDILYKGLEDKKYKEDKKRLNKLINEIKSFSETLKEGKDEEKLLLTTIDYMEQFEVLKSTLYSYLSLRESVNTSDSKIVNELNILVKQLSEISKPFAIMKKWIAGIEAIDDYMDKHPKLKAYSFMINDIKQDAKHLLSDDVEDVIARLNISAGSAWSNMQSYLTSVLEVEYRGDMITIPQVRNLAYSEDPTVRKDAYYAELKAYENVKDAVSYSLNNIKTQVNTIADLRGYESPLDQTLEGSYMKRETLEAMLEAMGEYMPVFHKYLKHKAKLLGHKNGLPWYDLFAPMGESESKFTVVQARDYLIKHFKGFSDDLADMVEQAFEEEWIDFFPRKGKVGGAFCSNMPYVKQSRVLTNFSGTLSDIVTLAHELGHAYHGLNIQEHLPLNTDYSMPVAETASNFNESLIMEAVIKEASGIEKMALIESQLQDTTQIMCDIYSRYLFETEVFEKSKQGFLFPDELNEIMLRAQKTAYGDGLDHEYLHPYMWVVKPHYYSEEISFYNFPYAFGGLFARGLYEKYKNEGEEFVPKYKALLNATTVSTVEDAAREAEINLEEPSFWRTSLKAFEDLVDEFIKLS